VSLLDLGEKGIGDDFWDKAERGFGATGKVELLAL